MNAGCPRGPWRVAVRLLLALAVWLSGAAAGTAQTGSRPWRETFQVDAPLLAAKRMESARGLLDANEWDAGLTALADLEEQFPEALVSLSPGRYLSVPLAARLIRLHLPPEGLAVYLRQIDGWAAQQLAAARVGHDEHALQRLQQTALASSHGAEAMDLLAEWAWERGEIATARRLWTQRLPVKATSAADGMLRAPKGEHDLAGVHARLILCSLAEGDRERAADELAVFATLYPDATGWLAGRDGSLRGILESLIAAEADWPWQRFDGDWTTFAGNARRNGVAASSVRLGRPVWTLPLRPTYVPRWEHPRAALPERGLLSRYPVTHAGGLFFHDGVTIHGVRLEDGQPLWPMNGEPAPEETPGKIYPPFPTIPNHLPWTPLVGIPRFTSMVDSGRLYALLGPSVLTLPEGERPASPTRLVSINLAEGEGQIEWFHVPEDLFPPGWQVTGAPLVDGERLYVPLLRTDAQLEVSVACLQSRTAALIWQQTVGQALKQPLAGRTELGHQVLTLVDGQLFFSTDLGAVATLDAATGHVEWVVTYPTKELTAIERSDTTRVGLLPPVVHEGMVFVKPNDSDLLMALDADTGALLWQQPAPGAIVHLLGVVDEALIVSGDHLWALDVATGRRRWRFGFDDAAGYGSGRGVLSRDVVFWPTHEDLFVIDSRTGAARQRLPLTEALGVTGGHLLIAGNRLVMAGPDHLTAFALQSAD